LNFLTNNSNKNRFAIVISKKSVKNNVERVFFRRLFYDLVKDFLKTEKTIDYVFVVKKKTKLDINKIEDFKKDIIFLINKI
jgi:ribonuclease P protein component